MNIFARIANTIGLSAEMTRQGGHSASIGITGSRINYKRSINQQGNEHAIIGSEKRGLMNNFGASRDCALELIIIVYWRDFMSEFKLQDVLEQEATFDGGYKSAIDGYLLMKIINHMSDEDEKEMEDPRRVITRVTIETKEL